MSKCKVNKTISFELTTLITGLMRSGKSYFAVHSMLAVEDDFNIFTNITDYSGKSFPMLSPNNLTIKVEQLYSRYMEILNDPVLFKDGDKLIREYQKEIDFFYSDDLRDNGEIKEALVIIDEAQHYLPSVKSAGVRGTPAFLWFITYMARFKIRFVFMTQDVHRIPTDYLNLMMDFYFLRGEKLSLRKIFNLKQVKFTAFRYGTYDAMKYKRDKVDSISIDVQQCIFEMYNTPKTDSNAKSPLSGFAKMIAIGVLVVLFAIYKIYSSYQDKVEAYSVKKVPSFSKGVNSKKNRDFDDSKPAPSFSGFSSSSSFSYSFICEGSYCYSSSPDIYDKGFDYFTKYGFFPVINKRDLGKCGAVVVGGQILNLSKNKMECYYAKKYYMAIDIPFLTD